MKLGLIAGTGDIPRLIAEDRKSRDEFIFILGLKGFTEDWMFTHPHDVCSMAELGKQVKALKAANCDTVSLIGNVRRPDLSKVKPDLKGMSLLPKILKAATQGDDALLRFFVEFFESEGFSVIGAQDLMTSLKARSGYLSKRIPSEADVRDISRAYEVAGEIGRLDIGQGAVVANGLVLAVEAQEGTDEMLKRVARLPQNIRGSEDERRGVLLKRPKPMQERRIDLPTIGPSTIRLASEAGLSCIAVMEEEALIVDLEEIQRLADRLNMSVVSLKSDGSLPE